MEIIVNIGIGDFILLRMQQLSLHIPIKTLQIQPGQIQQFRNHPDDYTKFLVEFGKRLFPNVRFAFLLPRWPIGKIEFHRINQQYLQDLYNFAQKPERSLIPTPYIVVHTKYRLLHEKGHVIVQNEAIPSLVKCLNEQPLHVVLMGEKERVEPVNETRAVPIFSMQSSLKQLSVPFTDLTRDDSYSKINQASFESDLHYMNGARLNIVVGQGGPLQLAAAFSKHTIAHVVDIEHPILDQQSQSPQIEVYRDTSQFVEAIRRVTAEDRNAGSRKTTQNITEFSMDDHESKVHPD